MDVKTDIKARIINAANHLVDQGTENPTNEQVRQRLGGGSLSHISPVMREWRQARREDIHAALQMPDELKQSIQVSLGKIWSTASEQALANTEQARQQAREEVEEMATELSGALEEITRLEKRLAESEIQAEHQTKQAVTMEQSLAQAKTDQEKLAITNATLSAGQEDKTQQIDLLREELKDARQENKTLQQELIEIVRGRDKPAK